MHRPSIGAKVYLWICTLTFLGLGITFVSNPKLVHKVDIELTSPTAMADVRADYGGCILGVGIFLVWCAIKDSRVNSGLLCTGLIFLGYTTARLISLAVDGQPKPIIYYLIAIEALGAVLAFAMMSPLGQKRLPTQ